MADAGPGSLRQAIRDAAAGATITFHPSLIGTIILDPLQQLVIDKNLTILGPGPDKLVTVFRMWAATAKICVFRTRSSCEAGKLAPEFSEMYFATTRPMFQLFDFRNDPGEFKNLVDDEGSTEVCRDLKSALHEWMILNRDFLPLPIPKGAGLDGPPRAKKRKK